VRTVTGAHQRRQRLTSRAIAAQESDSGSDDDDVNQFRRLRSERSQQQDQQQAHSAENESEPAGAAPVEQHDPVAAAVAAALAYDREKRAKDEVERVVNNASESVPERDTRTDSGIMASADVLEDFRRDFQPVTPESSATAKEAIAKAVAEALAHKNGPTSSLEFDDTPSVEQSTASPRVRLASTGNDIDPENSLSSAQNRRSSAPPRPAEHSTGAGESAADKAKSSIRARLAERRAQLLAKRNQQSHRSPPSASSSASIRERLAAARARRDNAPQSAVADSFATKVVTERSPEVLDKTVESDANKTPGDSRPSSDSDEDVIGIG